MKNKKTLILIFCLIFLATALLTKGFGLVKPSQTGPAGAGADSFINIPLSDVTNKAKWYEYDFGGNKIRFFAVKADDETVKTAFDACDVCYTYKKGYRQEGDYMICNNCGNRYPIDGLGTENKIPGGCWPGYLPSVVQGENIIIKKSDLENNQWRAL